MVHLKSYIFIYHPLFSTRHQRDSAAAREPDGRSSSLHVRDSATVHPSTCLPPASGPHAHVTLLWKVDDKAGRLRWYVFIQPSKWEIRRPVLLFSELDRFLLPACVSSLPFFVVVSWLFATFAHMCFLSASMLFHSNACFLSHYLLH